MKRNALLPPLMLTALTFAVSAQAADTENPATQNLWVENPTPPPAEQWPDMDYKSVPRPANAYFLKFYKKEDKAFCEEILTYFNRPGTYAGPYEWAWMISNVAPGHWRYIEKNNQKLTEEETIVTDATMPIEYAQVKKVEIPENPPIFAYRYTTMFQSQYRQIFSIMDKDLENNWGVVEKWAKDGCKKYEQWLMCRYEIPNRPSARWATVFVSTDDKPSLEGWNQWPSTEMLNRPNLQSFSGLPKSLNSMPSHETPPVTGDVFVHGNALVLLLHPYQSKQHGVYSVIATITKDAYPKPSCVTQMRFKRNVGQRPPCIREFTCG